MTNDSNKKIPKQIRITKVVHKGDRIIPNKRCVPIAVAEDNFFVDEIGIIDYNIMYPVDFKNNILLLPGLKKIKSTKSGDTKCRNKKLE